MLAIHIWLFWTGSESPTYWWLDTVTKFTVGVIQTFPQVHSSGSKFGKELIEVNQFTQLDSTLDGNLCTQEHRLHVYNINNK